MKAILGVMFVAGIAVAVYVISLMVKTSRKKNISNTTVRKRR